MVLRHTTILLISRQEMRDLLECFENRNSSVFRMYCIQYVVVTSTGAPQHVQKSDSSFLQLARLFETGEQGLEGRSSGN
jgi:hypothetical protein